jgi:hypothetical protein
VNDEAGIHIIFVLCKGKMYKIIIKGGLYTDEACHHHKGEADLKINRKKGLCVF